MGRRETFLVASQVDFNTPDVKLDFFQALMHWHLIWPFRCSARHFFMRLANVIVPWIWYQWLIAIVAIFDGQAALIP
jgi:hypothetical protein